MCSDSESSFHFLLVGLYGYLILQYQYGKVEFEMNFILIQQLALNSAQKDKLRRLLKQLSKQKKTNEKQAKVCYTPFFFK